MSDDQLVYEQEIEERIQALAKDLAKHEPHESLSSYVERLGRKLAVHLIRIEVQTNAKLARKQSVKSFPEEEVYMEDLDHGIDCPARTNPLRTVQVAPRPMRNWKERRRWTCLKNSRSSRPGCRAVRSFDFTSGR